MRLLEKSKSVLSTSIALSFFAWFSAPSVDAAVLTGQSSGYALQVNAGVSAGILSMNLNAGPAPSGVAGSAPAPYDVNQSVLFATVTSSVPLLASGSVTASLVNAQAESNIDGLPGTRFVRAETGLEEGGVNISTLPIIGAGLSALSVLATLDSSAEISGDHGALSATGSTTIKAISLSIGGVPVDLSGYVNVAIAPNTGIDLSLLGIAGATLVLNEQIIAPDNSSIVVNAFRLDLDATLLGLGVDAGIVFGHSQASLTTVVPEPRAALLLSVAALSLCKRKRW